MKFPNLKDKITQIMQFTNPDESTIPITPKLYGKRLSRELMGAPINIQSKVIFKTIPISDTLKGNFVSSSI